MPPNTELFHGLCAECEDTHALKDVAYDDRRVSIGERLKYQYQCPVCDEETTHYKSKQT